MASNNNQLVVKYCECRHNYAVRSVGHALDGCSEFCPIGAPGTPKALICAACHCHRSFHRRVEVELENGVEISHPSSATPLVILDVPPPQYLVKPRAQVVEPLLQSNNNGDNSEKETKEDVLQVPELELKDRGSSSSPVKMKLSPDQKKKVLAFTQDIMGWKWSKNNEQVIPFCAEVGITPRFLKNWINNNRRRIGPLKKNIKY